MRFFRFPTAMVRPLSILARFSFVISNIPSLSSVSARCTTVCSRRFSSVGIAAVAVPSRVISRRILHCHYVEKWRAATGHDTVEMCPSALTTRRGPPMSDELASVLPPNVSPASDERIAHDIGAAGPGPLGQDGNASSLRGAAFRGRRGDGPAEQLFH